jgi:hypothetical protein
MYGTGVEDCTENLTAPQWQDPSSSMVGDCSVLRDGYELVMALNTGTRNESSV